MITIDFGNRNNQGLCDYLFESIKEQILNGTLTANQKLPSKRNLAEHLGISVITVQNAYSNLISEGYIYSLERKGFFVTDLILHTKSNADEVEIEPSKEVSKKWFTDFTSNSTSYEKFPFALWSHIMRSVLNSGDEKLLVRQNVKGVFELRIAISQYLREFRNMYVNPEQIVIGAGTEHLYSMIVQIFGINNIFVVENPGFRKVQKIFELSGARCCAVNLDDQGINLSEVEKAGGSILHISPSHHFPTGKVTQVRRRQELLEWTGKSENRYIIEDDYDSEFRFTGKPLPTLQSADTNQRVIYINTFSKTLAPSFRISYMVLPKKLLSSVDNNLKIFSCPVSAFEQYTLARFISEGHYAKHIIKMKNFYRSLRNNLIQKIKNSEIGKECIIQEEDSGLHFLLTLSESIDPILFKKELENENVNISLLSDFYYSNAPSFAQKTFVINYSGIQNSKIGETVLKMEKAKQKAQIYR